MMDWLRGLFGIERPPECPHKNPDGSSAWVHKREYVQHPFGEIDWYDYNTCQLCGKKVSGYHAPDYVPPPKPPECTHTHPDGTSALKTHQDGWYYPNGEYDWATWTVCTLCNKTVDRTGNAYTDQEGNKWRGGQIVG